MIVDVKNHGVGAIGDDDKDAAYVAVTELHTIQASSAERSDVVDLRLMAEVLRRFGGLVPRALLGGRFVSGGTGVTVIVHAGEPWEERYAPTCGSRLWNQPFTAGLPAEFAHAVLEGLAGDGEPLLPSGTLTIDRAGFDVVGSATPVFHQTAALLRHALAARLRGDDVGTAARALISTW